MRFPFHIDYRPGCVRRGAVVLLYFVALNETNPEDRNAALVRRCPCRWSTCRPAWSCVNRRPGPALGARAAQRLQPAAARELHRPGRCHRRARRRQRRPAHPVISTRPGRARRRRLNQVQPRCTSTNPRPQVLPVRVNLVGQVAAGLHARSIRPPIPPARHGRRARASLVGRAAEAVVDVSVDRVTVPINGVYTPRIVDARGDDLQRSEPARRSTLGHGHRADHAADAIQGGRRARHDRRSTRRLATCCSRWRSIRPRSRCVGDAADLEGANFVSTQPIDVSGISIDSRAQHCARPTVEHAPAPAGPDRDGDRARDAAHHDADRARAALGDQSLGQRAAGPPARSGVGHRQWSRAGAGEPGAQRERLPRCPGHAREGRRTLGGRAARPTAGWFEPGQRPANPGRSSNCATRRPRRCRSPTAVPAA